MRRRTDLLRSDFSAFMFIVFMLAGCLLVILISNMAVVVVDPATVVVSGILRAPGFVAGTSSNTATPGHIYAGGNVTKHAHFVDVHPDHLIFYPDEKRIPIATLAQPGNPFEQLIAALQPRRNADYIVLLVRPRTAALTRTLRKAVLDAGLDVGLDIYEQHQKVREEITARPPGRST